MDGDEIFVLVVSGILTAVITYRWYRSLFLVTALGSPAGKRWPMFLTPVLSRALVFLALVRWASKEVREDGGYQLLFLLLGATWLGGAALWSKFMGVGFRDDAIERHNPAAMLAVCGALWAAAFCYATANIGEGPTIWTTIGPAFLATSTLFALWVAHECTTAVAESITVDRDVNSGLRLASWLIAEGLILGAAVAGNWESVDATFRDFFRKGWPALPLAVLSVIVQRWFRPSPKNPQRAVTGVIPAFIYMLVAVAAILTFDKW